MKDTWTETFPDSHGAPASAAIAGGIDFGLNKCTSPKRERGTKLKDRWAIAFRFHADRNQDYIWGRSPDWQVERCFVALWSLRLPRCDRVAYEESVSWTQWRDHAGLTPASLLCPRGHPRIFT